MATIITSANYAGQFVSTGENTLLKVPAGVKDITVYNLTQGAASQTTPVAVQHEWNISLPNDSKWSTFKSNAASANNLVQYATSSGFKLYDSSVLVNGLVQNTVTAISNAATPVVTNTGVNGLVAGDVVRLYNVAGALQFGGMDFTVGAASLTNTTFSLAFAPQIVAGTTGGFRLIAPDLQYEPQTRFITAISQAAQAVVKMSVVHNYAVSQKVTLQVPAAFGMVEANGITVTVLSVDTVNNTITTDLNTTSFTPFVFPLTSAYPFSPALVVPSGENTAVALADSVSDILAAWRNEGFIGIQLAGGANNPAGAAADVISYVISPIPFDQGFVNY